MRADRHIDCSAIARSAHHLNAGTFSNVGGGTGNISIRLRNHRIRHRRRGADTLIANGFGPRSWQGHDGLTCGAASNHHLPTGSAPIRPGFRQRRGDKIDLTALRAFSTSPMSSGTLRNCANTVINFGGNDSVTLQNVSRTSLTSDNFLFAPGGLQPTRF